MAAALALLLLGTGLVGASAQTIEGTVLEEGSGVPVTGAQVWLEDPDGDRVATFVTAALEIEGVVVTTEARSLALDGAGFYDRMRTTPGTFLEREVLRLESTTRLSDALMRTEGIERFDNASFSGDTTKRLVQFRAAVRITGRPNCLPAVYVDGNLVRWGETVDPDELPLYPSIDELVPPDAIEGVELYDTPASIPPRFLGPGSLCGVIVVWTRR